MSSHVRAVSLKLRVAERDAGRAEAWRAVAERTLLRNVLEALEAAIVARLGPDAIVRIQHLPLRWRLDARGLADAALHRRLGEELAEGVLADAGDQRAELPRRPAVRHDRTRAAEAIRWTRPRAGATVAVFADEVHELAAVVAARSESGERAFYDTHGTVEAAWQRAQELAAVASVMTWLDAAGVAERAIAVAPAAIRARVAGVAAQPIAVPARPSASLPRAVRVEPGGPRRTPELPAPPARVPTAVDPVDASAPPMAAPVIAPASVAVTPSAAERGIDELAAAPASVTTRAGGAFFLLASVLELELSEHLWCTGIAEGPHVAAVLEQLAPALAGDPAFAAIAGGGELVPLPAWAADEVVAKTRDSLGRWLARRGVATTSDALATRLVGELHDVAADALAAMVSERLGVAWSRDPTRALIERAGRIVDAEDALVVELPLASATVDVRRAGLDRDPGWIPWLRRTVRIAYVPGVGDVY